MPSHLLTVATVATDPDLTRLLALAVLAFLAWRLALIALFPWAPHRHCSGTGKHRSGRYWRPCRGCGGTGRKLRLGRRIWNWIHTSDRTR